MAGPSELRTHRVVMFSSHSTRHELWLTVNESIRTKGKQEQTGLEIPPETAPVSQLTGFYLGFTEVCQSYCSTPLYQEGTIGVE